MAKQSLQTGNTPSTLIEAGQPAPAFHLPDQDGVGHRLSAYKGRWVVLYFYPKDNTSGCTAEACDFRDASPAFDELDAVVLGVSPDDAASHRRFADKQKLSFTLLADEGAAVCSKYGVWQEKSLYGRRFMGVVRTTYLIDPRGKVAQRWDKVRVKGHVEAVKQALAALHGGG